jgi:hypothetical protein
LFVFATFRFVGSGVVKRTAIGVGIVFAVVVATLVVVSCLAQPSRVTKDNVDRIKYFMTRAEIEAILGPPGEYTTGPVSITHENWAGPTAGLLTQVFDSPQDQFGGPRGEIVGLVEEDWCGDTITLVVQFNRDSRACMLTVHRTDKVPQTSLENLLWRAKRLWRRFEK